MRLYVLRREVGEHKRIQLDSPMPVLLHALGRHFDDGDRTAAPECAAEKSLDKKSAGHGAAGRGQRVGVDFDAHGIRHGRLVSGRFEYCVDVLGRRGLAVGSRDADDGKSARRESVHECAEHREAEMICREQWSRHKSSYKFLDAGHVYFLPSSRSAARKRSLPPSMSLGTLRNASRASAAEYPRLRIASSASWSPLSAAGESPISATTLSLSSSTIFSAVFLPMPDTVVR